MASVSFQLAYEIGYDLAQTTKGAEVHCAPLYRFHSELGITIPNYSQLTPDEQSDLIAEAFEGWATFLKEEK